jgi:excinuclease UvrABC helicase subunit UvrB
MDGVTMEFLTGPASALVLAITLLSGLYRLAAKYLPALIDRHIKLIDDMQESQKKINEKLDSVAITVTQEHVSQNEAMRKAISGVHSRLNPLQDDLKEIKIKVGLSNLAGDES